jgi:serine/threonine-protein kinase
LDGPKAEILVEEGQEKGRIVPLRPGKPLEIGREGNLRLEDKALSRRHAKITWDDEVYRLEDVGSTWGTFVNGVKVRDHALQDGDRIRVGNHLLRFQVLEEDLPKAPTTRGPAASAPIPTPRAPIAADLPPTAEPAVEEDADDIPAAPAAAPVASRLAAPSPHRAEAPRPGEPDAGQDPGEADDQVVEGACFHCGKAIPPGEGFSEPDPLERPARSYCASCHQQYPLLGRVLANHLCEKVLGAGGMGVVYRGLHVVMGRRAALKTLKVMENADPTLVKRLLREATAGGRIHHPNIVSVHDTGEQDNIAYVVMEFVRGENLSDALRREKRFPVRRAVNFATQVADALAAAFRLGYIHRDIKPENVLLGRGDAVKVTDFGLAKNLKDGELGGLTRTGQVLGTMLYMPPEQIVSSKGSDQRADIYSLGATLFHLLTGRPPLEAKSAISLLMDIRTKEPPAVSSLVAECPPELDRIVQRCLRKNPAERYQAPDELARDLRAVLETL